MVDFSAIKTGGVLILFGFVILNIVQAGIVFYASDYKEWKPIADSTVGIVVASDNLAYEAMSELVDVEAQQQNPDKYSFLYKGFLLQRVFINLVITFLVLFYMYKGASVLFGGQIMDPTTKLFAFLTCILIYACLSAAYILIISFAQQTANGGEFSFTSDTAIALIPLKGLGYTIYSLVAHSDLIFSSTSVAMHTQVPA